MEMEQTALAAEIAGALGLSPRAALAAIAGPNAGNRSQNHVGRDVATLRRAGIRPEKVAGRWIVRRGELARWAAGQAAPEHQASSKRRPGRPRKEGKNGRLDVQMKQGGAA